MLPHHPNHIPLITHNLGRIGAIQLLGRLHRRIGKHDKSALRGNSRLLDDGRVPPDAPGLLPREPAEALGAEGKGPVGDAREVVDATPVVFLFVASDLEFDLCLLDLGVVVGLRVAFLCLLLGSGTMTRADGNTYECRSGVEHVAKGDALLGWHEARLADQPVGGVGRLVLVLLLD